MHAHQNNEYQFNLVSYDWSSRSRCEALTNLLCPYWFYCFPIGWLRRYTISIRNKNLIENPYGTNNTNK